MIKANGICCEKLRMLGSACQAFPVKSNFNSLRSSIGYYERPHGVVGIYGKGHLGESFFIWINVCRGNGCFGEQGLPVGLQECFETFHRGRADYFSWQPRNISVGVTSRLSLG